MKQYLCFLHKLRTINIITETVTKISLCVINNIWKIKVTPRYQCCLLYGIKKLWETIGDIFDRNKVKSNILNFQIKLSILGTEEPVKYSNTCNEYFSNVGTNISLLIINMYPYSNKENTSNSNCYNSGFKAILFNDFTMTEVKETILSLNSSIITKER